MEMSTKVSTVVTYLTSNQEVEVTVGPFQGTTILCLLSLPPLLSFIYSF